MPTNLPLKEMTLKEKLAACPSCGSRNIKKVRRNWTGSFKGKSYIIPNP